MSTTQNYIINIETSKAEKNTKSLKQEIKELKEQLYQLEEGSEEYSRVMDELAQKQFLVKDTQEKVNLAASDWGQRLANATRAMSGAVGAVQTYTSAMSLLGVEVNEDSELMEKLVASMALIQGISAVENSIDAFRALAKEIKLAGGAVGMLKKALNTLKAHPIIAIASAITAIGVGINQIYKAERKEQAEKNYNAVNPLLENSVNKIENIENDYEIKVLQARGATEEEIYNKKVELLKKYEKEYLSALEANANQYHTYTDELKEQADIQAIESQKIVEKKREQITEEGKILKIKQEQAELTKQAEKAEETRQKALEKQEEIQAKQEEWQSKLATTEDKNRADIEYQYLTGVITEIEYKERLLEIEETEIQNLTKKYELEGRNYHETKEYHDKRIQYIKDEIELENLRLAKEKERLENEFEGKQNNLDLSKQKTSLGVETEYLSKLSEIDLTQNIAEQVISIEQWKQEELYRIQKEGIEKQIALLQEKKDKGLISEYEFASEFVRLSAEQTELEKQQVQKRIELKENEVEANKAIQDLVKQNQLELSQSVGSILGGLADSLEEETESYKWLKSAEATIDTLSAAVGVFAGISKDTNGWGIALAIAKATAVMLTGMNTVRQIQSVNVKGKNNSNYSLSSSASNALNKNYTNTRLTDGSGTEINLGSEISKSMSNIKVWVSASEISNTQSNMKRVEVNNTF